MTYSETVDLGEVQFRFAYEGCPPSPGINVNWPAQSFSILFEKYRPSSTTATTQYEDIEFDLQCNRADDTGAGLTPGYEPV